MEDGRWKIEDRRSKIEDRRSKMDGGARLRKRAPPSTFPMLQVPEGASPPTPPGPKGSNGTWCLASLCQAWSIARGAIFTDDPRAFLKTELSGEMNAEFRIPHPSCHSPLAVTSSTNRGAGARLICTS